MRKISNTTTSSADQNSCPQKQQLSEEQILVKLKRAKAILDSLTHALSVSLDFDETSSDGRLVTVTLPGFNYEARYSQKEGYYILTEGPSGNWRYTFPKEETENSFLEKLAEAIYQTISCTDINDDWECDFLADDEDE